jgi:Zn-dependent protease
VVGVGLSIIQYRVSWEFLSIFVSAFLVHEFGHKFLAQMYHAWAEFRIIIHTAALTAFSALPILPLKFIAPGAVFISPLSEGKNGRVAWIGPLTNLAMGAGFYFAFLVSTALPFDIAEQTLRIGVFFNAWIAIFNLIPFFGLDGSKIFGWSKLVWVLTLAAAVGLFVASEMMGGRGFRFLGGF